MSEMDARPTVFHGEDAPVLTYVTTEAVITIEPTASVRSAAEAITEQSVGMLVIGTADDVLGVLSERDIVRAVANGLDVDSVNVAEIGSRDVVRIEATDTIGDAAEEMLERYVRHALVYGEQGLVGVLSIRDVLSAYAT